MKEYIRISWLLSAFLLYILGLFRCLNVDYNSVALVRMYMQCNRELSHISTINEIFAFVDVQFVKFQKPKTTKHWLWKFHSWQCIKLTIPSYFVNFAIEESKCIICLQNEIIHCSDFNNTVSIHIRYKFNPHGHAAMNSQ